MKKLILIALLLMGTCSPVMAQTIIGDYLYVPKSKLTYIEIRDYSFLVGAFLGGKKQVTFYFSSDAKNAAFDAFQPLYESGVTPIDPVIQIIGNDVVFFKTGVNIGAKIKTATNPGRVSFMKKYSDGEDYGKLLSDIKHDFVLASYNPGLFMNISTYVKK